MNQKTGQLHMPRITNFSEVWDNLAHCTSRGMYIFDDYTQTMIYTSYARIYERAAGFAGILQQYGITKGDRVLICARTTSYFPAIWLAHIWLGATPVPMPPREALTGEKNFQNRIRDIIPYFKYYLCNEDEIAEIHAVRNECSGQITIILLSEIYSIENKKRESIPQRCTPSNQDTAHIQFTSGSIGKPKGILISYDNLYANISAIWMRLKIIPGYSHLASWLPLYHDMGLVGFLLGPLVTQTELVLISPFQFAKRPFQFLKLIDDFRVQICSMPNFALEWIIKRYIPTKNYDFSLDSLTWIGVGAEPVNMNTLKIFEKTLHKYGLKKGVVSPCYGLAEATLAVSIAKPFKGYKVCTQHGWPSPSVGKILTNVEVKIVYKDKYTKYGHILIKGDFVAKHALINGKKQRIINADGYYDTKDIGYFDNEELVIIGRSDDMFIIAGENYFPYEIEAVVRSTGYAFRNRAVCFDIPEYQTAGSSIEIVILYESRNLPDGKKEMIESKIKRLVISNTGLSVSRIISVPPKSIPVTPSGKIKRQATRKSYLEGHYQYS